MKSEKDKLLTFVEGDFGTKKVWLIKCIKIPLNSRLVEQTRLVWCCGQLEIQHVNKQEKRRKREGSAE